jgi:putative two-component system hydrogenase maturation factor HypX/HoxX
MRVLLLTHSFNGLAQRLYVELSARGHVLSVEFDISESVTREAVALFRPDVVIAPFLKRAIPEDVWRAVRCLIVHPGIKGDRGPSALDWAILEREHDWGVTVLQANAEMDAGDIWAAETFPLRAAAKSSLYRREVTEAAVRGVLTALERMADPSFAPEPLDYSQPGVRGRLRPLMRQADRAIDWAHDRSADVLAKVHAADGSPGVVDEVLGVPCRLFGAWHEGALRGAHPGDVVAQRDGAILRATRDGAVWITHLRAEGGEPAPKLPAAHVLGHHVAGVPAVEAPLFTAGPLDTWRELAYEEHDAVGYLRFEFHNGAMSTTQCERLTRALRFARTRPTRVLVLLGGSEFWSNGIHLNVIEAARAPADESWRNINAMDDVCREILGFEDRLTIAAMQGNAGAGGVFLALAADRVVARSAVVLNPHYKNMGNLYGSEYWTYLLPRRVGHDGIARVMENRLPVSATAAAALGLIDEAVPGDHAVFLHEVGELARYLATRDDYASLVDTKRRRRATDEAAKPLDQYRDEELERMRRNFYGFDPSYHVARHRFVHRTPHSWTPRHLAVHRQVGYRP